MEFWRIQDLFMTKRYDCKIKIQSKLDLFAIAIMLSNVIGSVLKSNGIMLCEDKLLHLGMQ